MRHTARLVAACTASLVLVALAPGTAHAAAVTSRTPSSGAHIKAMPDISVTLDGNAISRSITVTPPVAAGFSCTDNSPAAPSPVVSCHPAMSSSAPFPQGTYSVHVTATVVLPAVPGAVDDTFTFVYDSVAPAAPTGLAITPAPYTKANAPTSIQVNGVSEGATDSVTVTLTSSGGGAALTATAPAGAGGTFGVSFPSSIPDGTLTASAVSTDAAGNAGSAATATASKDTVLPTIVSTTPTSGGAERSSTSGTPNGITVVASEPLGAGSSIVLKDASGTTVPSTTSVITSTTWKSVPSSGPLTEGSYTATITLVDAVGNTASPLVRAFTVDDSAAAAPSFDTPLVINAARAASYTVTGTGEPGATVSLSLKDSAPPATQTTLLGSGTVAGNGTWTISRSVASLVDGDVDLSATQTDGAGNTSAPASASTAKDTVAPRVSNQAFGQQLYKAAQPLTVVLTGKVDNGTTTTGEQDGVTVTVTDAASGTASAVGSALADGTFSIPVDVTSLADGTLTAHLVALDAAGNAGAEKTATTVKDTGVPGVPTLTATDPVNAAHAAIVSASGVSEEGAQVSVTIDDASASTPPVVGFGVAGAEGAYSVAGLNVSGLNDGTLTVLAQAMDAAGNTGGVRSITITKDTVAPAKPVVTTFPAYVFSGNVAAVPVSGTAAAGSSVALHITDGATGSLDKTVTATNGTYGTTVDLTSLAEGPLQLSVVASDAVGNPSQAATRTSTKDTVAPGAPVALAVSPSPMDSAHLADALDVTARDAVGDRSASDLVADITVSDTDPATADLTVLGVPAAVTTGDIATSFANDKVRGLTDGVLTVRVVVRDPAGNLSTSSTTALVKDVTDLALVSASPADSSSVQAAAQILLTLNEALVTGTSSAAPPYSRVSVTNGLGNPVLGSLVFLNGNKAMRFTPSSAFTEAASPYTVTLHATDANDTADTLDKVLTFTVDVTAPVAPTLSTVTNPVTAANKGAVVVTGNAGEPGLTVAVTISRAPGVPVTKSAVSTAGGSYTVSGIDVSALPDGVLTVSAASTDAAGNGGPASATSLTTNKDATLPTVSGLAATATRYGHLTTTVTGTLSEAGTAVISATQGLNTVTGTATVAADKTFRGTLSLAGFSSGPVTIKAHATDTVGNLGPDATATSTHDAAIPPSAPAQPSAVPGDRRATVSFTAPFNGGATITSYTVVASPGGKTATGTRSPITVTGLANGVDYTFKVKATNRVGSSPLSSASAPEMPLGVSTSSLNALPSRIVFGTYVTLSGTVHRSDTSAPVDELAIIVRYDSGALSTLAYVTPSSTGAWSYRVRPSFNWSYYAVYGGDEVNDGAASAPRHMLVSAKVTKNAPAGSHTVNQVITGTVSPNKHGKTVYLYRVTSTGSVVKLAAATLSSTSTYRFSVRLPAGYTSLRVYVPSTPNNASGWLTFKAYRT